jgi:hypothetical protein
VLDRYGLNIFDLPHSQPHPLQGHASNRFLNV